MNSPVARIFCGIVSVAFLITAGCAKKNKPDVSSLQGDANRGAIQEKDLTFDATGSDSGKIDGLASIHFAYDKSSLTEESRATLVKDAHWLKAHTDKSLQIEGHCDRHGSIEYNLALGQRRAEAVKKYLVDLGLSQDRLSTISYGKEHLLDTAETEEADAQNRRANFKPVDSPKIKSLSQL